jgi:hypothetical protein
MSAKFEPIKIVTLDISKTEQSKRASGLRLMYLQLSQSPSSEWEQIFDNQRQFPRHSMWREARIEGSYIVVDCVPEEMEQYHLRDLKEDVNAVNVAYQAFLNAQAILSKQEQEAQQAERNRLEEIKSRLKFN